MGDGGREADTGESPVPPAEVRVRTTRRPFARRRRRRRRGFRVGRRFKDLEAPTHLVPDGVEDIPVIGPIIIAIAIAIFLVLLVVFLAVLALALIEMLVIASLAVLPAVGGFVAWLRRHPEVTILDVDGSPWVRTDGFAPTPDHVQRVTAGTDPSVLGFVPYRPPTPGEPVRAAD